jgi:uncharacterized protein YegP (UPF0339 family)
MDTLQKRVAAQHPFGAQTRSQNSRIVADSEAYSTAAASATDGGDSLRYTFDQLGFAIHPVPLYSCQASYY